MSSIRVLGMDPSLRNWGLAVAYLDLDTGVLTTPEISVVQPSDLVGKQVRNNSNDLHLAMQLADGIWSEATRAQVIFVEVPHGSQSARAMASYGIVIGILGSLRSTGTPFIEVTAGDNKLIFTSKKNAPKELMISTARELYPDSNWPVHKNGSPLAKCEHMADAIAAIHAGVRTPAFQNLLQLFSGVKQ